MRVIRWVGLLGVLSASVAVAGCATNPATGQRQFSLMSEAQELQIGQESDLQVRQEMGVYDDPELQRYVESVGLRMAQSSQRPNLPWHFTIVDSPAVNAFALPGGYIYITRGILAYLNDESQMAGVLGHEIGHVTARHAAQQYTKSTAAQLGLGLGSIFSPYARAGAGLASGGLGLLFLKYGREDELQADRLGAEYEAKNGWDPQGMQDMLRTLARIDEQADRKGTPNYLATHPASADRVQKIDETVAALRSQPGADQTKTNKAEYLRRIDGLVFGDNPRDGVLRGNEFLHPNLRFAMKFPSGWNVDNGKDQVTAKAPSGQAFMLLGLVQQPIGTSIQDLGLYDMRRLGFQAVSGGETDINGLRAFIGTFQGSLQNFGLITLRVGYVPVDRRIFRIVGLAPARTYAQSESLERDFTSSIRSFRALSRAEAEDVRPNRIDLYTVRPNDTWASIAEGPGRGLLPAAKLALINGVSVEEQPRPGDRVKIVVTT
jgi:predicted Zn-dependent protease